MTMMTSDEPMLPAERRFTLDGAPVDINEFIEDNGFAMPDVERIAGLSVGEEVWYGGGAAPMCILRREADSSDMLTETQRRFVELDRRKAEYKLYLEELKAATEALVAEMGVGKFFQDEAGIVYQTAEATGRFVYYEKFTVNRTRREGEAKGTLAMKAAKEAGFAVEG